MFSEKYGYKPEMGIQYESVSKTLRIRIWNLFYLNEIQHGGLASERISMVLKGEPTIEERIADRLGLVISSSADKTPLQRRIESFLIQDGSWYEIFDFIEIHLEIISEDYRKERARQYNRLLEEEKSGYRIVSGEIAPITNQAEIEAIESATESQYKSVNKHIQKALSLYSDLENPDYENSIKESISAVEAVCCIITGLSGANATLGKAIKKLEDNGLYIHSALTSAFSSLYGYTSDENGIRHGGIDFKNAPVEDAKYMLVSCSAFVNYLIEKHEKLNLERQ